MASGARGQEDMATGNGAGFRCGGRISRDVIEGAFICLPRYTMVSGSRAQPQARPARLAREPASHIAHDAPPQARRRAMTPCRTRAHHAHPPFEQPVSKSKAWTPLHAPQPFTANTHSPATVSSQPLEPLPRGVLSTNVQHVNIETAISPLAMTSVAPSPYLHTRRVACPQSQAIGLDS